MWKNEDTFRHGNYSSLPKANVSLGSQPGPSADGESMCTDHAEGGWERILEGMLRPASPTNRSMVLHRGLILQANEISIGFH